jgi:hypothetical protein
MSTGQEGNEAFGIEGDASICIGHSILACVN